MFSAFRFGPAASWGELYNNIIIITTEYKSEVLSQVWKILSFLRPDWVTLIYGGFPISLHPIKDGWMRTLQEIDARIEMVMDQVGDLRGENFN